MHRHLIALFLVLSLTAPVASFAQGRAPAANPDVRAGRAAVKRDKAPLKSARKSGDKATVARTKPEIAKDKGNLKKDRKATGQVPATR